MQFAYTHSRITSTARCSSTALASTLRPQYALPQPAER